MAVVGGVSMGELRERMKRDMEIRGFSPHTRLAYLRRVAALARYLGRARIVRKLRRPMLGVEDCRVIYYAAARR